MAKVRYTGEAFESYNKLLGNRRRYRCNEIYGAPNSCWFFYINQQGWMHVLLMTKKPGGAGFVCEDCLLTNDNSLKYQSVFVRGNKLNDCIEPIVRGMDRNDSINCESIKRWRKVMEREGEKALW